MADDLENNIVEEGYGGNVKDGGEDSQGNPDSVMEQLLQDNQDLKRENEQLGVESSERYSSASKMRVILEHVLAVSSGLEPVEIMPDDANPDEWVPKEPRDLRLEWIKEAVKTVLSETQNIYVSDIDKLQEISNSGSRPVLHPDGRTDSSKYERVLNLDMEEVKERANIQAIISRHKNQSDNQYGSNDLKDVQEGESQAPYADLQREFQEILKQVEEFRSKLPPEMKSDM